MPSWRPRCGSPPGRGGDADLAAKTLGLDYLREGGVGEFALGSLAEPE
jgi:hypothetical protein